MMERPPSKRRETIQLTKPGVKDADPKRHEAGQDYQDARPGFHVVSPPYPRFWAAGAPCVSVINTVLSPEQGASSAPVLT